jgi:hypothetical protein
MNLKIALAAATMAGGLLASTPAASAGMSHDYPGLSCKSDHDTECEIANMDACLSVGGDYIESNGDGTWSCESFLRRPPTRLGSLSVRP